LTSFSSVYARISQCVVTNKLIILSYYISIQFWSEIRINKKNILLIFIGLFWHLSIVRFSLQYGILSKLIRIMWRSFLSSRRNWLGICVWGCWRKRLRLFISMRRNISIGMLGVGVLIWGRLRRIVIKNRRRKELK
jgi:hypothetical protein